LAVDQAAGRLAVQRQLHRPHRPRQAPRAHPCSPARATGDYGQALAGITRAYLATLAAIMAQIEALAQQISTTLDTHPDKEVFVHLPKAGTVRAARLLAEIGDARGGSHRRLPRLPLRRRPVHPRIRQSPRCGVPLGRGQTTA